MEARKLTQEFIDDFLGYFMNPANRLMSSLLLGCGLPGGMMGSMMADLTGVMGAINNNRAAKGEPELSEDELLVRLFDEVAYVWPRVGYPPLVTPFSQYVKNIALMNLLTESMGKPRYSMMDNAIWGMILGKSGQLPGAAHRGRPTARRGCSPQARQSRRSGSTRGRHRALGDWRRRRMREEHRALHWQGRQGRRLLLLH